MGLLGRPSRGDAAPSGQRDPSQDRLLVPGLAEYAAGQGWRPAGESPLSQEVQEFVHDAARTMYGVPRAAVANYKIRVTPTIYRDGYAGQADGHQFVLANGWTSIIDLHAVSVCQLQLGWFLSEPVWIEPARYISIMPHIRQLATGDPAFDHQFRVHGAHGQTVTELLGENVRALMRGRDDWFFTFAGASLLCVCREGYRTPQDVREHLAEVIGLARALPSPSAQGAAAKPILLSGGAVFDPANIEAWKAALMAAPPAQREQLKEELRARLAERRASRPAR